MLKTLLSLCVFWSLKLLLLSLVSRWRYSYIKAGLQVIRVFMYHTSTQCTQWNLLCTFPCLKVVARAAIMVSSRPRAIPRCLFVSVDAHRRLLHINGEQYSCCYSFHDLHTHTHKRSISQAWMFLLLVTTRSVSLTSLAARSVCSASPSALTSPLSLLQLLCRRLYFCFGVFCTKTYISSRRFSLQSAHKQIQRWGERQPTEQGV